MTCKIKEFRERNDYTQRYIAYKVGVSQQAVYKWENGEALPSPIHLVKLSKMMDCPIEELISGEPQKAC